jgi:hypothetical protein
MKVASVVLASLLGLGCVAEAQPAQPYPGYGPPGAWVEPVGAPPVQAVPVQAVPVQPVPVQVAPVPAPGQRGPRLAMLRQALLANFDANHDGVLEPQERRRAARVLRRLARQLARPQRPGY